MKFKSWPSSTRLLFFVCSFFHLYIGAQTEAPIQMPDHNNEADIYAALDYFHFSAMAWDKYNRPYGFNANKDFGFIRTLRNGQWQEINYLDDLEKYHSGAVITKSTLQLDKGPGKISITSDNHLYATITYKMNKVFGAFVLG